MSLIPKKGTVYVVDDDEAVRDSLQWLLEGKDYRVRCFDSAESFLSRYDPREVACLIVDIRMGGMTGLETLRRIRQVDPKQLVILMTAYGTTQTAIEAMKLGAFDYLLKPVESGRLEQALQRARRRVEAERPGPMPPAPSNDAPPP